MAYRYRVLSGTVLLGLLGLAAYSIASRGHYEEAHMLIGPVPELMSDEAAVSSEEETPEPIDSSVTENEEPAITLSEEKKEEAEVDVKEEETPVVVISEESPKVEESPAIEPKVEVKQEPTKTPVVEEKETSKPVGTSGSKDSKKPNSGKTTQAKGKKSEKPDKGVDISKGPLTVSQNPDNDGKFTTYELGDSWKNQLLDTANPTWWVVNEKHFINKYHDYQLKTQEFKNLWRALKGKDESTLDGTSLMKMCGDKYSHRYDTNNDPYATDIWLSCLKLSDSSYPKPS